jgi:hypothetical protein
MWESFDVDPVIIAVMQGWKNERGLLHAGSF